MAKKFFILVLTVFSVSGCAMTSKELMQLETNENSILLQNKEVAKNRLLEQYNEWKGTKYKYGGSSKNGIDCSGFVYQTFLSKFGIKLPRKSIIQAKVGISVPTDSLQPGDLIFFKIRGRTRHVGIYIENNEFIHVSKSQGVIKSSLNNPYWHKRYKEARRIVI